MRSTRIRHLSTEEFLPYGRYANMIHPDAERIGAPPVEFFRDMIQQEVGAAGSASFSTCRVEKRDLVIDVSEYHSYAAEGILPLDNDILVHVAPATPCGEGVPVDKIVVFRVPLGTLVVLRPGVWHHAPFTVNDRPANVLIVLPERTYANDCHVHAIGEEDRIRIQM